MEDKQTQPNCDCGLTGGCKKCNPDLTFFIYKFEHFGEIKIDNKSIYIK